MNKYLSESALNIYVEKCRETFLGIDRSFSRPFSEGEHYCVIVDGEYHKFKNTRGLRNLLAGCIFKDGVPPRPFENANSAVTIDIDGGNAIIASAVFQSAWEDTWRELLASFEAKKVQEMHARCVTCEIPEYL